MRFFFCFFIGQINEFFLLKQENKMEKSVQIIKKYSLQYMKPLEFLSTRHDNQYLSVSSHFTSSEENIKCLKNYIEENCEKSSKFDYISKTTDTQEIINKLKNKKITKAIIVPLKYLHKLKLIKNLEIRRFEAYNDFWTNDSVIYKPRFTYDYIFETCDKKFWESNENFEKVFTDKHQITLDVIIWTGHSTFYNYVLDEILFYLWKGSEGKPRFWSKPGIRSTEPIHNPHFVFTPSDFNLCLTYRFPTTNNERIGGFNYDQRERYFNFEKMIKDIDELLDILKESSNEKNCLVSGTPKYSIMDFREEIILEDENNPDYRNILPMDQFNY
jgi:hypothetical protein